MKRRGRRRRRQGKGQEDRTREERKQGQRVGGEGKEPKNNFPRGHEKYAFAFIWLQLVCKMIPKPSNEGRVTYIKFHPAPEAKKEFGFPEQVGSMVAGSIPEQLKKKMKTVLTFCLSRQFLNLYMLNNSTLKLCHQPPRRILNRKRCHV